MGMAFGEASFLLHDKFISIQGDVVNMAARMESHAIPGLVSVHSSAVDRWVYETRASKPPMCKLIYCKGKKFQSAATYDCVSNLFCDDYPDMYDI